MLRLGKQNIDIPAGDANYVVRDSYVLPVDAEVRALQPHAHYRARDVRGVATLPDGTQRTLIHIRDWDFQVAARVSIRAPVLAAEGDHAVDGIPLRQLDGERPEPRNIRRRVRGGVSDRLTRWATCGCRC